MSITEVPTPQPLHVVAAVALSPRSASDIIVPPPLAGVVKNAVIRVHASWQFNTPPSNNHSLSAQGMLYGEWYDCESAEHVVGVGQ